MKKAHQVCIRGDIDGGNPRSHECIQWTSDVECTVTPTWDDDPGRVYGMNFAVTIENQGTEDVHLVVRVDWGTTRHMEYKGLYYLHREGDDDWEVADVTVVRDAHVLLEGNLTVKSTGDLTLVNVTLEMNVSRPGRHRIIVDTGGELTLMDGDGDPATTGDRTVVRSSNPAREYQWLCEQGSTLYISGSAVRDCGAGWGLILRHRQVRGRRPGWLRLCCRG